MNMSLMKHYCLIGIAIAILGQLSGCAIGYTRVTKPFEGTFAKYQVLQIPDLRGSSQVPEEVKKEIPDKVAQELAEQKLFAKVERSSESTGESVLILKGQVVQYNPGSRGMRWLTGPIWGVGKGSIIVNTKFIDKASGKELSEASFEGEIKGGIFGGGIDETHAEIAHEIVQFIKSNY